MKAIGHTDRRGYITVEPTAGEILAYTRKRGHAPGVGMVECGHCGKRLWNSGFARSSHERGSACEMRAWAQGKTDTHPGGAAPASAKPSAKLPGLTAAQAASLRLVAAGHVSYAPGRNRSTRYSYSAYIGGKFVRRTKSVDALYGAGLVELTGSASSACVVVLTERGAALLGVDHTPVAANLLKRGVRIITADGTVARIVEMILVEGGHSYELRLSVDNASFARETYGYFAPVKVAPVPVIDEN